jgi:histidinol-phosphate/aromatic aminotransferase/cobyric acid decarboxylase-like protein
MARKPDLTLLIEKHKALEAAIKDSPEHFLSDWNGDHPFVERYLGPELLNYKLEKPLPSQYIYFDNEEAVLDMVCDFHLKIDSIEISRHNVVAGPGSSSLLVAFSLWLLQNGYKEVYYVPPLYYTFHYFLRLLGIRLRPISGKHAFESKATLNLPPRQSVLLLTDPVWYAGRPVPRDKIHAIAEWQKQTNSLVFIDGSFQYMQWDGIRHEQTSMFEQELTFRLISPTKSLAIPFFRFAYLLHPSQFHSDFLFLYENMMGGANIADLAFARRSLQVLSSAESNRDLTALLRDTYDQLNKSELIKTRIIPECGYFIFAIPTMKLPGQVVMDQDYFELKNYRGYVRINLMVARRLFSKTISEDQTLRSY